MKNIVSFITVGHSPREDIVDELNIYLSKDITIRQRGALDSLSIEEVGESLRPQDGEQVLTCRLRDKNMVEVSKSKVITLLQKTIDEECRYGTEIIAILCTNEFSQLTSQVPLIIPFQLMRGIVTAVKAECKVGALFPFQKFAKQMETNWNKDGVTVLGECVSPKECVWEKYVELFKQEKVKILILDCIGYTYECRNYFKEELNVPVIHPKTVMVCVIHSLLGM